ncbi:type 1 glutamine amidotransferase domain-containing protein [Natronosalvus vescus]|uniref:type 1 glutamine amidotransferase domain-containing protein n=1 Tax=Natronosalvus vescus TaxID=2953881 RepID=UPI0020910F5E|nr:type 1 glutamine amidotransferase domain-containing protein [Natronosalvus vescus]
MTDALFVVSEYGYWGEECIDPLETLEDAGVEVTIATPSGGPPEIDHRSIDPEQVGEETAERVKKRHQTDERLNDPVAIADVHAEDFDVIVFPGGHGTEWDVNQDHHARDALRAILEGDGKALVVCHAVGILAFARDSQGAFLGHDRIVTGFPNEWEADIVDDHDLLPDGRKLPYWVEDEVVTAGANWDADLEADTDVVVDGDLITGRGPASSRAAAETLLEELDL